MFCWLLHGPLVLPFHVACGGGGGGDGDAAAAAAAAAGGGGGGILMCQLSK
jgi:hypothetical protein